MITGYIASTEGKVMIDGHDILEEPEAAKKCIGYLPEMPPLYFDMTVLEYMKFAADLKKIPRNQKDKQIKEVMDMVKITDMKDRLIKKPFQRLSPEGGPCTGNPGISGGDHPG